MKNKIREALNELRKSFNQYVTHIKERKDKLASLCEKADLKYKKK